jgi:hypothetical protein
MQEQVISFNQKSIYNLTKHLKSKLSSLHFQK